MTIERLTLISQYHGAQTFDWLLTCFEIWITKWNKKCKNPSKLWQRNWIVERNFKKPSVTGRLYLGYDPITSAQSNSWHLSISGLKATDNSRCSLQNRYQYWKMALQTKNSYLTLIEKECILHSINVGKRSERERSSRNDCSTSTDSGEPESVAFCSDAHSSASSASFSFCLRSITLNLSISTADYLVKSFTFAIRRWDTRLPNEVQSCSVYK